jgi:hypothetical protein
VLLFAVRFPLKVDATRVFVPDNAGFWVMTCLVLSFRRFVFDMVVPSTNSPLFKATGLLKL